MSQSKNPTFKIIRDGDEKTFTDRDHFEDTRDLLERNNVDFETEIDGETNDADAEQEPESTKEADTDESDVEAGNTESTADAGNESGKVEPATLSPTNSEHSQEFRVEITADGNQAAEEFLNTLRKIGEKAEFEHGITVDVQRVETDQVQEASFSRGGDVADE